MSKMTNMQLKKLSQLSDDEIDYSDIPSVKNTKNWKRLYSDGASVISDKIMFDALSKVFEEDPEKVPVTIKLDKKVITFFKDHSKKYQVKINEVLLAFVKTYEQSHSH